MTPKACPMSRRALIAKGRELASAIEGLQRQSKIAVCDYVEASLRIFARDFDLSPYGRRPVRHLVRTFPAIPRDVTASEQSCSRTIGAPDRMKLRTGRCWRGSNCHL